MKTGPNPERRERIEMILSHFAFLDSHHMVSVRREEDGDVKLEINGRTTVMTLEDWNLLNDAVQIQQARAGAKERRKR